MAIVNKFNINGQQVTLDADIIENISVSANDVSYDDSFQYDENTIGDKLSKLESQAIYDVTANNDGVTFSSLSELLSSENLSTLIPSTIRCGGMSIRFVQSSDNKYVQYHYTSTSINNTSFTSIYNWISLSDILFNEEDITSSTKSRFYDSSNKNIGDIYTGTLYVSTSFEAQKVSVKQGEKYYIETYDSTASAKSYVLTNSINEIVKFGVSSGNAKEIISIESDGTLYLTSNIYNGTFLKILKIINVIDNINHNITLLDRRINNTDLSISELATYEKNKRHSSLLEHLYNPTIITKIKLFGDSVTHGLGSSDYSETGELIPYANSMRNVGVKSYAAIFANQILENYSEIPINIYASKFITRVDGGTTYDGRFHTTNLSKTLVQFEFYGTYFYLSYIRLTNNGGKFKIIVDDVENTIIDTSLELVGGKIKIDNLNDGHHTIKFVGTGESSVTTSTSYISFDFVILPKKIEIINNGVSGYKTKAIVNLVQLLTDSTDNFVTIMGGLNDREYGGAGETLSSFIGIAEWARTNRNFELIYLTPNPASQITSKQFENVTQVSRAVKSAADYEDIQCVDIYNYLTKYCVENNKVLKDICPDNLHPNDFAHKLISDYLLLNLGLSPNFIN